MSTSNATVSSDKFGIYFTGIPREKAPAVSYKLRTYYINHLTEHLFKPAGIVLNQQWQIMLSIIFMEEGPHYTGSEIFLAKGARTVSQEKVKIYEMIVPLKLVSAHNDILEGTIHVLEQALTVFFTHQYKKVTAPLMQSVWDKVDLPYLQSLPFPAPLAEQKYVGDLVRPDGSIEFY